MAERASTSSKPGARERGRMRRRLREQQRMREALLLDLGALVFELHRHGRREPELLQAKAAELNAVDGEVRALADALGSGEGVLELVVAGIAGSCSNCGALLSTDTRYCPACGAAAVPGIGPAAASAPQAPPPPPEHELASPEPEPVAPVAEEEPARVAEDEPAPMAEDEPAPMTEEEPVAQTEEPPSPVAREQTQAAVRKEESEPPVAPWLLEDEPASDAHEDEAEAGERRRRRALRRRARRDS